MPTGYWSLGRRVLGSRLGLEKDLGTCYWNGRLGWVRFWDGKGKLVGWMQEGWYGGILLLSCSPQHILTVAWLAALVDCVEVLVRGGRDPLHEISLSQSCRNYATGY